MFNLARTKSFLAIGLISIILIAGFAIYAGLTYPRLIIDIPISFTIGADSTTVSFNQPQLNDKIQVVIIVQNGVALWQAQIINGENIIWQHSAGQGQQTSYNSDWMQLQAGSYNFTFSTLGLGSLEAIVEVNSKGGFW